jgi:hypothetical protein
MLPSGIGLEWLRGLGAGLIGGGAPVAAKVGAVFATATIVGGGTVAVEQTGRHHAHAAELKIVGTTPVASAARPASPVTRAVQVAAVAPPARALIVGEHRQQSGDDRNTPESSPKDHAAQQVTERDTPTSNDGAAKTARTGSPEYSGTSSEAQPAETESRQESPESTTATSAAEGSTSAEVTSSEVSVHSHD